MQTEAFHLTVEPGPQGQRFCVLRAPDGPEVAGLVVHAPPFAEELNKTRRMVACQSRALAAAGFAVLQIDPFGCGDSEGDFGDATWTRWVADLAFSAAWLRAEQARRWPQPDAVPLWLWGLRSGCLLAVEAAEQLPEGCNLLFWQAPAAGRILLQQFLRLRSANSMLGGSSGGDAQTARADLAANKSVTIAGYELHPDLAQGLESATLRPPRRGGRLVAFEVTTRDPPELSPGAEQWRRAWTDGGWAVEAGAVRGPAFWQTTEIEEAPALARASSDALMARSSESQSDSRVVKVR